MLCWEQAVNILPSVHTASVPTARGELLDRGVCGDSKDNGHPEAALEGDRRNGKCGRSVCVCVCVRVHACLRL